MGVAHRLGQARRPRAERVRGVGVERGLRQRCWATPERAEHEVPERQPPGRRVVVDTDARGGRAGGVEDLGQCGVGHDDVGVREREGVLELRRLPAGVREHDRATGQTHAVLGDDPLGPVRDGECDTRAGSEAEREEGVGERVPGAVELPVGVDVVTEAERDLLRVTVGGVLQEVVERTIRVVQRRAAEHGLLEALDRT